ncbi:MAG TPA: UDP-N-acetylmuramoyl-L-alanine--D-glutamate ligase [Syntrophales bacterium]|nr:UDP-N-acetylmuramoyl-L-alanine--D-glutamate ligase [Syntrophales bacterium]HOX93267.1 UDP-N-acetylmuramoyl-L-alanine--D-glutamate ligase [Syntrophales bacterium]HPI56259.1 UDP-N-acetylmuramoyl-L-alanine--D-glutamate ligase [Syntrophales bacterium]HPN24446.1 UDP-N-acetylmuramoyl-L-alanine--D-glutamate ligase [Syntrophales bacterium]HQM29076.1 UDP-N-acetylmuramoyl-L-alanine--D-glutamate ligase [Syntrophales bacterium]
MELAGKRVLVIGLGKTGQSTVRFIAGRGASVTATDDKPFSELRDAARAFSGLDVKLAFGPQDAAILSGVDLIIPSPGVPPMNPLLAEGVRRGVPILAEIEVAFRFLRRPVVAITGTNGKTTATTLVGEILRASGRKAHVGGNIGDPLIGHVDSPQEEDVVVVEVSSFQLEWIEQFRPAVAMLLNVTCDHIDYHGTFEAYRRAKERIFENQGPGDLAILNADEPWAGPLARRLRSKVSFFSSKAEIHNGMFLRGDELILRENGKDREIYPVGMIRLPGTHNVENVMASILACRACGCSREGIIEAVRAFRGVAHRIEFAGEKGGISFYDDSKGTNVGAVTRALETFSRPVILLLGGRDKGGDFDTLTPPIRRGVKEVILFGEAGEAIGRVLGGIVKTSLAPTLGKAVEKAYADAAPGDVVLLSPGCASFDEFKDYRERGDFFKGMVRKIIAGEVPGQ